MRRRNVPCSPCSGGSSSGDCCGLKEKLKILWDRTIGSILRINGISPDGDGDFAIEAGSNIAITERGTGNGIRIDTTGGVSYYESGDSYVNVDNNDLEITVNVGTGGLATDTDLQTVAGAVADILDGTTTIPNASNATTAGTADALALAGMDTNPTSGSNKAVTSDGILTALNNKQNNLTITEISPAVVPGSGFSYSSTYSHIYRWGQLVIVSFGGCSMSTVTGGSGAVILQGLPKAKYQTFAVCQSFFKPGTIGHFSINTGATELVISTYATDTSGGITCEMVYVTDDP